MTQAGTITERGRQLYADARFLEANGWREECPLPRGWRFSHPEYGLHWFEEALVIAKSKSEVGRRIRHGA